MFKKIIIITIYLYTLSVIGQNFQPEFSKALASLTSNGSKLEVDYIKNKETLYFKEIKNDQLFRAYRILLKDIHPEGIFINNTDSVSSIRILSINNGHVFIEEDFKNKYRRSNTTNFIDVGTWSKSYEEKLLNFITELKKFIKSKTSKKGEPSKDIDIIVAPTKRKH